MCNAFCVTFVVKWRLFHTQHSSHHLESIWPMVSGYIPIVQPFLFVPCLLCHAFVYSKKNISCRTFLLVYGHVYLLFNWLLLVWACRPSPYLLAWINFVMDMKLVKVLPSLSSTHCSENVSTHGPCLDYDWIATTFSWSAHWLAHKYDILHCWVIFTPSA